MAGPRIVCACAERGACNETHRRVRPDAALCRRLAAEARAMRGML